MVFDRKKWRKEYYQKNKAIETEQHEQWRKANREKNNQYRRNNYNQNKEKEFLIRQTEEYKRINARNQRDYMKRKRTLLLNLFGNKCLRCGNTDLRVLQFDHIKGQGIHDTKIKILFGKSLVIYYSTHLEEAKKELQLLCANCNIIKKYENHEFRHYKDIK